MVPFLGSKLCNFYFISVLVANEVTELDPTTHRHVSVCVVDEDHLGLLAVHRDRDHLLDVVLCKEGSLIV